MPGALVQVATVALQALIANRILLVVEEVPMETVALARVLSAERALVATVEPACHRHCPERKCSTAVAEEVAFMEQIALRVGARQGPEG
jgi:hypothetical protein